MITLEECSKEELIYYIKMSCFRESDFEFDVLMFRADKEAKKCNEYSRKSIVALQQHSDFTKKYNGCKICDIPTHEFEKANEAFKQFENFTKKVDMHQKKYDVIQKKIDENLSRRD